MREREGKGPKGLGGLVEVGGEGRDGGTEGRQFFCLGWGGSRFGENYDSGRGGWVFRGNLEGRRWRRRSLGVSELLAGGCAVDVDGEAEERRKEPDCSGKKKVWVFRSIRWEEGGC